MLWQKQETVNHCCGRRAFVFAMLYASTASNALLIAKFGGFVLFALFLVPLKPRVSAKQAIPPNKRRGVITIEELMMPIVLARTTVERYRVEHVEGQVVARVGIIGNHQPHIKPSPHKGHMICEEHACSKETHS